MCTKMGKRGLKKGVFFPSEKKGKWLFRGLKKVYGCFRANLTAVILDKASRVYRILIRGPVLFQRCNLLCSP